MKSNQRITFRKACLWIVLGFSFFVGHAAHAALPANDDRISFASDDASSLNDTAMYNNRGEGGISNSVTVSSDQNLTASSSGNSVNVKGNLTNGAITTGNNFGGSGFGSYVMNTGNNSTINSGVSLSVLMMPSGAAPTP